MKELQVLFSGDGSFLVLCFSHFSGWIHRRYSAGTKLSEVVATIETSSPFVAGKDGDGDDIESLADGWINGYYELI